MRIMSMEKGKTKTPLGLRCTISSESMTVTTTKESTSGKRCWLVLLHPNGAIAGVHRPGRMCPPTMIHPGGFRDRSSFSSK